jgi:hypothetical protein
VKYLSGSSSIPTSKLHDLIGGEIAGASSLRRSIHSNLYAKTWPLAQRQSIHYSGFHMDE